MRLVTCFLGGLLAMTTLVHAELPTVEQVSAALGTPILPPGTPLMQVQEFCEARIPRVPVGVERAEWERLVSQWRTKTLNEVIFRGQAAHWRELPTEVQWLDVIENPGAEYRIRKLRFQAVPGMWVPGLLYEPKTLSGPTAVMLAVNGHDAKGKAADYKQIRCINLAKRGMLVLNLEWLGMGQLRTDDFFHYRMNQLDLVGTSGIAPFYLSMSRGLDILLQHEYADRSRVAVSGLSGGGWQTVFISGLDERVTLANPVAGYSSFLTRSRYQTDLGDSEQTPSDLATVVDYTHLTAMRAPHPTLLTYNDRDNCCFAAPHALPPLLEVARPAFRLFQADEALTTHVNHIPGTHNFEQDNREALYRMIGRHFYQGQKFEAVEIACAAEVLSPEALNVELPATNLGFKSLASDLAKEIPESTTDRSPESIRETLRNVTKLDSDLSVTSADEVGRLTLDSVTVRQLRLELMPVQEQRDAPEWTVPVVIFSPETPTQCVLFVADEGRSAHPELILDELRHGHCVVALDPFYFGESKIPTHDFLYALLTAAVGERPVGIQAAQIMATARWVSSESKLPVAIRVQGRRLGVAATIAAALEPTAIQQLTVQGGFDSLRQVLNEDLSVNQAPELFCFGLLERCDLPVIRQAIPSQAGSGDGR